MVNVNLVSHKARRFTWAVLALRHGAASLRHRTFETFKEWTRY